MILKTHTLYFQSSYLLDVIKIEDVNECCVAQFVFLPYFHLDLEETELNMGRVEKTSRAGNDEFMEGCITVCP